MFYELFVITASALGMTLFLLYFLAVQISGRIPDDERMIAIGKAVVFGDDSSPSSGGRRAEGWAGFLERAITTPVGQDILKMLAGKIGGGAGGMTNYGP